MFSKKDVSYIRTNFMPLRNLCEQRGAHLDEVKALIDRRQLPHPSYTLDDGTEMVPPDYFALYDAVGGENIQAFFRQRFAARAEELGKPCDEAELAAEWDGYLSGDYGVCLHEVTPENICAKGLHMNAITELLAEPRAAEVDWRDALRQHVDALDELERPFADYDRVRWGPVSRDRLITAVRERYPQAFA